MRSGILRHRLTIQTASTASSTGNAYNEPVLTWTNDATVPAEVLTLSGDEAVRAAQVQPDATVQVTMRYRSGLTTGKRFRFGDRYLYPVGIVPDPRNTKQVVLCKEQL